MPRRAEPRIVDPATHPRRVVSLRVAAEFLTVDVKTLTKYLDEGLLAYERRGAYRRITTVELAAFEARQHVGRRVG